MAIYVLGIICLIEAVWLLWTHEKAKHSTDGIIFLDKNENGDDRIVFTLNFEYDEIANKQKIIFDVINKNEGL